MSQNELRLEEYRRVLAIFSQLVFICLSYILAFFLRFEFSILEQYWVLISKTLPVLLLIRIIAFYHAGLFSGLWRYAGMDSVWRILKGTTISTLLFILAIWVIIPGMVGFPRSVFILDWIICTGFISGARLASRILREALRKSSHKISRKVLIIGAGEAGFIILREYQSNPSLNYQIVGFIDDSPSKMNLHIRGVRVLGNRKDIPALVSKYGIEEIVLAIPSAKGEIIRDILGYCQLPEVKIKIVPGLDKIISGDLEVKPRQVKPEDLLGRETVKIDEADISSYIRNKRVLVTGAGGSIGSELCRQIIRFSPAEIVLFDHNENDVYFLTVEFKVRYPLVKFKTIIGDMDDIGLLKYVFSRYRPEVLFHAAAYKHVPLMEENPVSAVKNNIFGSRNLIYAADHYRVERFVLISTDKAVNPISVMGMTKRAAEMILQAKAKNSKTKFMAVRFGNVIGSSGSVVPLFKRQIEDGGPVTITHPEAKRYFMSVREAASLVLQAAGMGKGGEIFILDMGEQIKIVDIAKDLIALSGLKLDKDISLEFVGLREGEKLSEEILLDTEKDQVTKHDKIYITQPNNFDSAKLRKEVKELERLANLMDAEKIKVKLKEILRS